MHTSKLVIDTPFPLVELPTLNGCRRAISEPGKGLDWALIVVYRGKHCPLCTQYLRTLNAETPALNTLGIDVVAVSADSESRAAEHLLEVGDRSFDVTFDLDIPQMKRLGLYISGPNHGMDVERPFAEPGLFVVNEDGNLLMADISNVPFARPDLSAVVRGMRYLRGRERGFSPSGTFDAAAA